MIEQYKQVNSEMPAQTGEKQTEKRQKWHVGRSKEDKIGRVKYHEIITKKSYELDKQILDELRWIRHRLKPLGEADYDPPMIERYAFCDEVDRAIFDRVFTAGSLGVLPKKVAADPALANFKLKYYEVSRRIVRMNKRVHFETGECLFEKRGHRWAVTAFGFDVWGKSKKEVEEEKEEIIG